MRESRTRGQGTKSPTPRILIVFVRRRTITIDLCTPGSAAYGGADRDRTDDLKLAKLALSQLSYGPRDNNISIGAQNGGPGTS